jgi:Rho-associated protein kinase 2
LEEELHNLRTIKSGDDLQKRELQDQLEAEQYFSTIYASDQAARGGERKDQAIWRIK